jgi:hypothetical protein
VAAASDGAFLMRGRWLQLLAFGLVLSAGIGGVQPGYGYLLPGRQILEFVAERTAKVYNFRLEAVSEQPGPAASGTMVRRAVVLYGARPDFLRREASDPAAGTTILVGSRRRLSVIDGHAHEQEPHHEDIFPILLFADSAQTLEGLLAAEHVDTSQVRLDRMGRQIAYVIGGSSGAANPQFWCDKDHFWPLRLVGRRSGPQGVDVLDIRLLSYQQVGQSIWMPSVIEFYQDHQLHRRLIIEKVHCNENLPQELFDLRALAAKYPPLPLPAEPSEPPPESLEEMRRYLEDKYD